MDNLTHSLVGALIGQAGLKRKTGLAMPALIIGANIPDVDAACLFWLDGVQHLGFRRGITHGPIAWVLLPLLLAGALYWFDRWQTKRGKRPEKRLPVSFKWLFLLSLLGCLTHPALDWLNVYGIRLLEPFSHQWSYGDTLFIIDVWLWVWMGAATWFSLQRERSGRGSWRFPAIAALAAAVIYMGGNSVWSMGHVASFAVSNKQQTIPAQTVIASPPPLRFWDREIVVGQFNDYYIVPAGEAATVANARPISTNRCQWPNVEDLRQTNPDLDAFLFWSRTPFAEAAADGSVLIRDARFYDPRGRDRFTVALPDVQCEPFPPN